MIAREDLIKCLKSFNENENNDFISKKEETLIFFYLLSSSNTCLANSAKHRGLSSFNIANNIMFNLDLFAPLDENNEKNETKTNMQPEGANVLKCSDFRQYHNIQSRKRWLKILSCSKCK